MAAPTLVNVTPQSLPVGFADDLDALIRQNMILKRQAEKAAVEQMEVQEEVTQLREEKERKGEAYSAMQRRLEEITDEREKLSAQAGLLWEDFGSFFLVDFASSLGRRSS